MTWPLIVLYLISLLQTPIQTVLSQGTVCIEDACTAHEGPWLHFADEDREKPFVWTSSHLPLAAFGTISPSGPEPLFTARVPVGFRFKTAIAVRTPITIDVAGRGGKSLAPISFDEPPPGAVVWMPSGSYDVTIAAKGHLNGYLPRVAVVRSTEPMIFDVNLEAAPTIHGRVVSSAGGESVPDVDFTSELGTHLGTSGHDGRFALNITEAIPREINLVAKGYAPRTIEYRTQTEDLGTIILEKGHSLELKIEHPTTAVPLPIIIKIREKTTTGKPGRVFDEARTETGASAVLTALNPGPHMLDISGPGELQRFVKEIEVLPVDVTREVVWLEPSQVRGVVTYGDEIFSGARVEIKHSAGWTGNLVATADGELDAELWQVGEAATLVTGGQLATPYGTMVRLAKADPIYLDLHVPATAIEGRVTDERGGPVAEASVKIESLSGEVRFNQQTRTAPDGRYRFTAIAAGSHELKVTAEGYLPATASVETKRNDSAKVDFTLTRGASITIRARRPDGTPIAKPIVAIGVTSDRFGYDRLVFGEASGVAKVALPRAVASELYVIAHSGGWAHRVIYAEEDQELVVDVPAGDGTITMIVTDADGKAAPNVGFAVRHQTAMIPYQTWRIIQSGGANPTMTDSAGRISYGGLPPGEFEFFPFTSGPEARALMFAQGGDGVRILSDGRSSYTISVNIEPRGDDAVAP